MNPRMTSDEVSALLATMSDADFVAVNDADDPITDEAVERLVEAVGRVVGRPSLSAPGKHSPQITLRLPRP